MESVVKGDLMVATETELLRELKVCVERISSASPDALSKVDLVLVTALINLLTNFNRLSEIHSLKGLVSNLSTITPKEAAPKDVLPETDVFSALTRQLSDFQLERSLSSTPLERSSPSTPMNRSGNTIPPVLVVEEGLVWSRIETGLENVVKMCKERVMEQHPAHLHLGIRQLPPEYNLDDYDDLDDLETLPDYDYRASFSLDDKDAKSVKGGKSATTASILTTSTSTQLQAAADEKMRLDLEAVTLAIDRLYAVAPQLHNQRVELKQDKVREMARASSSTSNPSSSSKASKMFGEASHSMNKEEDVRDLEMMMEMIGKASERTLKNQSVILEGKFGMQSRL